MTDDKAKQKILVIKLGALGDFVQALGPMKAIRNHHPDAHITLLTTEPYFSLGRDSGHFDDIWIDTRPRWHNFSGIAAFKEKLNDENFDRVYDLQNNDRTNLYFKLLKTKPEWSGTAKGASHANVSKERTQGHAFEGHKQTLALAGIKDVAVDDMSWIKGDLSHFDLQQPYILLVPGCAPSRPQKRWPASNYSVIARTLYGWGLTPIVIGTIQEKELAEAIQVQCPNAIDLTGQTSITDIVLLARDAAGAIGNDTGPMHLIAPTGCPSYVLFSSHSNPLKHAPIGEHVTIIQEKNLNDLKPQSVMDKLSMRDFKIET